MVTHTNTSSHDRLIKTLIEHNVVLQKKSVDIIDSTNQLNKRIGKLLDVFEEASKHVLEVGEDKKILDLTDKLEMLLDQNKNISRGLEILENYVKNKAQFEGTKQY
ncbi:hypothetical protein CL617_01940 [archaeon]|nr:hypothetical protein [archaeon]|tara:strand:- start:4870 stop:5187 length:318 start_codon:yes stop_codon:yes gene_type:complete